MPTTYSVANLNQGQNHIIKGKVVADDIDNAYKAFDGLSQTSYRTNSADCNIGIELPSGLKAKVSKARIFIREHTQIESEFRTKLSIDSFDGASWSSLVNTDRSLQTGWNTIQLDNSTDYSGFRVSGSDSACKFINEIEFIGFEYLNSNSAS